MAGTQALTQMQTAIILFAHGSRDAQWREPIEAVATQISRRQPQAQVRCAYLEISAPTLPEAAADLIARGAQRIKIFPLFLGVGKHARDDLPLLIGQLRAAYPDVTVELLPAAGEYKQLTNVLADIALS